MPKCPTCNDKRFVRDNKTETGYVPCPSCNSDGNVYTIRDKSDESIEPPEGGAHPSAAEESLEAEGYKRMPGE